MSGFKVVIQTDSSAFGGNNLTAETVRILREVADKLEQTHAPRITVRDANGNPACNAYFIIGDEAQDLAARDVEV